MHYVYTVVEEVLDTLLYTSRRDTTPDGSYCYTTRIPPSMRCPKWRCHQLDLLHHEYEPPRCSLTPCIVVDIV